MIAKKNSLETRILIISNSCFSKTDANGRTLSNLFQNFDKQSLAQFFVYGTPNFDICENYYQVSNKDAMNSFLKLKEFGKQIHSSSEDEATRQSQSRKVKKTPLTMLFREFVWKMGKWNGKRLKKWIDDFCPSVVLVSVADNCFLIRLAIKIAKRNNIPIYVYSTENYQFKNYNYLTKRFSLFYYLFYKKINKWNKKLQKYVKKGFFNTPLLVDEYAKCYTYPCECVYNGSQIDFIDNSHVVKNPKISYLGNLGIGRVYPLVEIANEIEGLFPDSKLDVYGKLPDDERAKNHLLCCKNIDYKGFVDYNKVVDVIHNSNLVVHAELDDEFYSKDLKYAFSTKIADSVCSGTPLLIYARNDLAGTDFLIRYNCAFVVEKKEELTEKLKVALLDYDKRKEIVRNAKIVRDTVLSNNNGLFESLK